MLKNTITMKKYNFRKQQICYLYRLTFARIEYHSNNSRILLPPADILLINQSNCFLAVLYNNGRNEEDTSFNDRQPSSLNRRRHTMANTRLQSLLMSVSILVTQTTKGELSTYM